MATAVNKMKCKRCTKIIENRQYLQCSLCKYSYDIECANVSEARFYNTMSKEGKASWRCQDCLSKQSTSDIPAQDDFHTPSRNVTTRSKSKFNVPVKNSFETLSEDSEDEELDFSSLPSTPLNNKQNRSCPEMGENPHDQIELLNNRIDSLQAKLASAEQEIENLLSENFSLKSTIEQYKQKINTLASLCRSSTKSRTTVSTSKKTRRMKKNLKNFNADVSDISLNQSYKDLNLDGNGKSNMKSTENQQKKEINGNHHPKVVRPIEPSPQSQSNCEHNSKGQNVKNKICMISTNKHNPILSITENYLCDKYEVCHYLTPGVGVRHLLYNIENKLTNFTKNDYCLIVLGENDFYDFDYDCYDLILYIRKKCIALDHTNILICAPTFKCGYNDDIFNWKVEKFNKLLYNDIQKYEYAYLLDSNLNLSYDYDMFNRHTGRVNNYGLKIIFQDLYNMLVQINEFNKCINKISTPIQNEYPTANSNNDFFRL